MPYMHCLVADYALSDGDNPTEVLYDINEIFVIRADMASLEERGWVNSVVISAVCRMMNGEHNLVGRHHYFDPSFSVLLSELSPNASTNEVLERYNRFFNQHLVDYDISGCELLFLPVCENNHSHVHVVNIPASRVEILSSVPMSCGKYIRAGSRRLSSAIERTFHAHGLHKNKKNSNFDHVQPDLVHQQNSYDCGIFIIKFLELWNGSTLRQGIADDFGK